MIPALLTLLASAAATFLVVFATVELGERFRARRIRRAINVPDDTSVPSPGEVPVGRAHPASGRADQT